MKREKKKIRLTLITAITYFILSLIFISVLVSNLYFSNSNGSDENEANDILLTQKIESQQDQEAVDCRDILSKFRQNLIKVAENTKETDYRRSFVALSSTPKPFYIATHDAEIDHARSVIFKKHYYYETYFTEMIVQYYEMMNAQGKESIFLDVGSNIGWFSLVAAAHGASKIYAFEPNLQNTIRFCESISLNNWLDNDNSHKSKVIPITKGLGNTEERKPLYAVGKLNPGTFTFSRENAKKFRLIGPYGKELVDEKGEPLMDYKVIDTLEITTLDSFAERHGWFDSKPSIGYLKVDVEHFELEVFEGAQKLLESNLIEFIAFELKMSEPNERKERIVKILFESGYDLYKHGPWKGPHTFVSKVYDSWQDLASDFTKRKRMYEDNVVFRLNPSKEKRLAMMKR